MALVPENFRYHKNPFGGENEFSNNGEAGSVFDFQGENRNIFICPETHGKASMDIGWKLLVGPDKADIDMNYILDSFQNIYIQESIQETKVDTVLDAVKNVASGFKSGREAYKQAMDSGGISYMGSFLSHAFSSTSFLNSLLDENSAVSNMKLPLSIRVAYALQYCLMNREIGNTYSVPYNSQQLYVTNGTEGWKPEVSGFGGTSSNSFLGKLLNFVGSQVRISTEPIWQGAQQASSTTIQIKFNLFNDTFEKAEKNFTFIQNIMPNNLFVQYGILQQAPAYYDVHIFGNRRYPLCQGNFQCNYKGMMRLIDPNQSVFLKRFLTGMPEHQIFIPDIYEVDLTFKSLLPDTYNDFLYFWYLDEFNDMNPISKTALIESNDLQTNIKALIDKGKTISDDKTLEKEIKEPSIASVVGVDLKNSEEEKTKAIKKAMPTEVEVDI